MATINSFLPTHAEVLKSACLEFLGYAKTTDDERDPVVDFSVAFHSKESSAEMMQLYRRIESPGARIISTLIRHFLAQGNTELAVELMDDINSPDLAPTNRVLYAELLAERGDFEGALAQIARTYSEDETLQDVHARIAWKIFWPKKEYDKVLEWMGRDAGSSSQKSEVRSQNHSEIQNPKSKIQNQQCRLSPAMRLNLAQAYAAKGDIKKAASLVHEAYVAGPTLKDGYARIAWQFFAVKKDYSQVGFELLANRSDYSNILRWTNRDLDSERLSPQGVIVHAKARAHVDGIDALSPLVEKLYDENPDFKNAWAQIAWALFIPGRRAFREALPFLDRDRQLGRLQGEWVLNYAQALTVAGREVEAERLILDAYSCNSVLLDGFSRCAWAGFWPKKQYRKVIEWMERDSELVSQSVSESVNQSDMRAGSEEVDKRIFVNHPVKRISANQRLNLAQAYAAVGDFAKAEEQVAMAYDEALDAKNGYTRIAWQCFWPRKEYDKVLDWMGMDLGSSIQKTEVRSQNHSEIQNPKSQIQNQQCRLSPAHRLNFAQAYAAKGDLASAESLVESAYAEKPDLNDGYARVGWACYWPLKEYDKVIEWMERDCRSVNQSVSESVNQIANPKSQIKNRQCRLSPAWLLNRAKVIAKVEGIEAAFEQVDAICVENPDFKNAHSQVAWMLLQDKRMTYEETIPYFEKDRQEGRLIGEHLLNYAEALAATGNEAESEKLIQDVYKEKPALKDVRARIAWKIFWPKQEYDKVIEWMKRDLGERIQESEDRSQNHDPSSEIQNPKSQIQNPTPPIPPSCPSW